MQQVWASCRALRCCGAIPLTPVWRPPHTRTQRLSTASSWWWSPTCPRCAQPLRCCPQHASIGLYKHRAHAQSSARRAHGSTVRSTACLPAPQGLPATVTSLLTLTALRLRDRRVLIKRTDIIENLGVATIIARCAGFASFLPAHFGGGHPARMLAGAPGRRACSRSGSHAVARPHENLLH